MKSFSFRVLTLVIIGTLFLISCEHLCADDDENNAALIQTPVAHHFPDSLSIKND